MKEEKHLEILKEVEETIQDALKSSSMLNHQRRLMTMISLGVQQLLELYLHRLNVIKPGTQLKHEWLKLGERNAEIKISSVLTTDIRKISKIGEALSLAREIEKDRNDLIYGSPLTSDRLLREKIEMFFEIKKLLEA